MRLSCWAIVVFGALSILAGCSSDSSRDSSGTAIKVNNVTISIEEFNEMIKEQAYSDPEMTISEESRREYVDYLIRKELMIQEAIRLRMDRQREEEKRRAFIKTIETYWESTLIRRLLDYKTAELKKRILITEEEVQAYYDGHRDKFDQPYDQVKSEIKSTLVSNRIQTGLEAWIKGLRADAKISVNPSLTADGKQ